MIETKGYLNNNHRFWSFDPINYCSKCYSKNKQDAILEMFLRFKLYHLLKIENDNFDKKFHDYKGIEFIFTVPNINYGINIYNDIILYYIKQKLIFGIGFRIINNDIFNENINNQTSCTFIIPILAFGKMWKIIFNMLNKYKGKNKTIIIDEQCWKSFNYKLENLCLLCNDYPFGIYPGNFIVNQNILYMKGFIWMDKKISRTKKYWKNNSL